jgi:deoxyadenosine/deoxycytidine kinase
MIIFINGSFGVGKSSVAEIVTEKIPNSLLYDAEEVGYMLRKIYKPIDDPEDFQDLPIWRELVVKTADALKRQYRRTLIMPMCIWNETYFNEVIPGLKTIDSNFYHFCLLANRETVINRLKQRNDTQKVNAWAIERLDKSITAYQSEKFDTKIFTDNKPIDEVANEIIANVQF